MPVWLSTSPPGQHDGTRVTLLELTRKFRIEDVKNRLRETVPLAIGNFSCYLNGKKVTPHYIAERSIPFMEEPKAKGTDESCPNVSQGQLTGLTIKIQ